LGTAERASWLPRLASLQHQIRGLLVQHGADERVVGRLLRAAQAHVGRASATVVERKFRNGKPVGRPKVVAARIIASPAAMAEWADLRGRLLGMLAAIREKRPMPASLCGPPPWVPPPDHRRLT